MPVRLTPREQEVAALIANWGLSNKAIAKRLGITESTVERHVENIVQKLPGLGRPRHRITVFFLARIEEPKDGGDAG